MSMSKMFKTVTRTWNPITGCRHDCSYCWFLDMVRGRLKGTKKYINGAEPTFHPSELKKKFKPGEFVFVTDMGDIFSDGIDPDQIESVLKHIATFPGTDFLLQTKNPVRFNTLLASGIEIPANCYLGTTIESDKHYFGNWHSQAPSTFIRYMAMTLIPTNHRRFLSIEPIVDFNLEDMVGWIRRIKPQIIEIGADNHNKKLPEPSWEKVEKLISSCRSLCPDVKLKDGLDRLKNVS